MAMAAHMTKLKMSDMNGIRKEDDRSCDAINKKNPDLNLSLTKNNYSIVTDPDTKKIKNVKEFRTGKTVKWDENIKKLIKKMEKENIKNGGKRYRRDAVVCGSWVLGADKEFMESLTPIEKNKYFKMMFNYLGHHYGFENIASFTVHMDEGSAGAHCRIVPITKDGRLCAKEVFNPVDLSIVQKEMYEYLHKEFPTLEPPDFGNSKRKHLDELTYKYTQEKTKLAHLRHQKNILEESIQKLQNIHSEVNMDIWKLQEEQMHLEKQNEEYKNQLETISQDLEKIISLRTELETYLKEKSRSLGLKITETAKGFEIDIKNAIKQTHKKLEKPTKNKEFER